jgi:ABC-type sugar transport system permease subunit
MQTNEYTDRRIVKTLQRIEGYEKFFSYQHITRKYYPIFLVIPAIAIVLILVVYPLLLSIQISFYRWTYGTRLSQAEYIGLANYYWVFFGGDYLYYTSLQLTLLYVLFQVAGSFIVGLLIAILLDKLPGGGSVFTSFFIIPMVIMPAVAGLMWRLYFTYDGFVNYFLESIFKIRINWFSTDYALIAVSIASIWVTAPFFILVFYAALTSIPNHLIEAARIDGASEWTILTKIKLPLLKSIIYITLIIRIIEAIRSFDLPYVTFGGGPGSATEVLAVHINRIAFQFRQLGAGSVLSLFLILLVTLLCFLLIKKLKESWGSSS